jgi:hypothetical protein
MSDIVPGLRRLPEPQCSPCYAAADEIERLGRLVRLQDAEIARLRLTDAEREAVDTAEASLMRESTDRNTPEPVRQRFAAAVNTLRGLLERTRNGSPDGCETVR